MARPVRLERTTVGLEDGRSVAVSYSLAVGNVFLSAFVAPSVVLQTGVSNASRRARADRDASAEMRTCGAVF